jgi:uncharacterized repeat protein (TIGR03809 family)
MSARVNAFRYRAVSRKWSDLAERRCVHLVELYRSGRWTHYYTEQEFLVRIREAIVAADAWARLAKEPDERAR